MNQTVSLNSSPLLSSFKIGSVTVPHRLILAPMCGITLKPFRQICKEFGGGLVFNQMVSAKALTMRDKKSLEMLSYDEGERPVGMQLFGNDAHTLAEAAKIIQDTGADIIDLNLGCPAKKIVNDGGGSALLKDEIKLHHILKKIRQALQIPFTIKIRAGWDDQSKNSVQISQMAEAEGVDAIALHARTRAQGYSGDADWSFIKHLKESVKIPVIGNGDIENFEDVKQMIDETGCDAVMTGRGAFQTPWIFQEFLEDRYVDFNNLQKKELVLKQYNYFIAHFGLVNGIKMMRKHMACYSKGIAGGAEFRRSVLTMDNWNDIQSAIADFFK